MKVRDIMTTTTQTILPDATLEQAAKKMRDYDVGLLPIVANNRVLGVITDRDLVVRAMAAGYNPHLTVVREIMTSRALWCYDDQTVSEAAKAMEANKVRRLVILDRNFALAGVLTLTDIATKAGYDRMPGHVLNRVASKAG